MRNVPRYLISANFVMRGHKKITITCTVSVEIVTDLYFQFPLEDGIEVTYLPN